MFDRLDSFGSVADLQLLLLPLQGYLAYDNSTTAQRPAVVIIPDYDGIGPYEMWRAELIAQSGYAGEMCNAIMLTCFCRWIFSFLMCLYTDNTGHI